MVQSYLAQYHHPISIGGGGWGVLNQWDEAIYEMRELGQKPNEFMENTLFKE